MLLRAAAAATLSLTILPAGDATGARVAAPGASGPAAWTIGPLIRGRNYSRRMPLHPSPGPGGAWHFDFPRAPGSVHYVTRPHGPLLGKRRIVMRYRVEADPGVRILPRTAPNLPSIITLYFQRGGDNWTGAGPHETYRWYATFASRSPITPGEYRMVAPLNANWTAIRTSTARTRAAAFREALADADQVGFVLGGGDGFGHGVFATGRARLVVTDFRVE